MTHTDGQLMVAAEETYSPLHRRRILTADGDKHICEVGNTEDWVTAFDEWEANAVRICGCWNALAGISNDQIERDKHLYLHVAEMRDVIKHMVGALDAMAEAGLVAEDSYQFVIDTAAKIGETQ